MRLPEEAIQRANERDTTEAAMLVSTVVVYQERSFITAVTEVVVGGVDLDRAPSLAGPKLRLKRRSIRSTSCLACDILLLQVDVENVIRTHRRGMEYSQMDGMPMLIPHRSAQGVASTRSKSTPPMLSSL